MTRNQDIICGSELVEQLPLGTRPIECVGFSGSEKAFFVSMLARTRRLPTVVIVSCAKEAERLANDLRFFSRTVEFPVLLFEPYRISPFRLVSYHNETAARRIHTLYHLLVSEQPSIVVTPVDALLQKLVPKEKLGGFVEPIEVGEEIERDRLVEKLLAGGYVRTAIVEEPGDFCVRGGILDVFSPLYSEPLRIEFFGDVVDSMRLFSALTQRKVQDMSEAVILPAKEAIIARSDLPYIIARIRQQAAELDLPVTQVRRLVEAIKSGDGSRGMESLMPLIYPKLDTLFDFVPQNSLFIVNEPGILEEAAQQAEQNARESFCRALEDKQVCVGPEHFMLSWTQVRAFVGPSKPLIFRMLEVRTQESFCDSQPMQLDVAVQNNTELSLTIRNSHGKENLLMPLADWIRDQQQAGRETLAVCRTQSQAQRLIALLRPYGLQLACLDDFPSQALEPGSAAVCLGQLSSGFVWPDASLALVTEDEIFGTKHHRRRASGSKVGAHPLDLQELKTGDRVVHAEHGIGRYEGLVKLTIERMTNDFLLLHYRDDDKLYVPVDRMSAVQKYMGVEGVEPVLDKMGGKSWDRVKARVKKSAEKIAADLLKIYARRQVETRPAFRPPDGYFQDFEAGFAYEETPDQIKAIEDVLQDMQQPKPMDRLVCGDVGYGKTEVALRASFLAVNEGKQVAVLVPTTILAEQHFRTFKGRLGAYPVNVACLSRFRTARQQRALLDDLKAGRLDIVIGTHRLLQRDIAFKDLGLLVVDEEQRFGVKHKETLKKLRSTVDVLALTATPLPRTLHLSLVGIRDISVISTPPEYRQSIITYISEFDGALIADAIRQELGRNGQIYFVHNDIFSIERIAKKIKQLVPEVRLEIAHGRLEEQELEQVMLRFINKEIDLLLCTTIIESGLDIPSANTIIINRADKFGLAQIYQLRGRVGRAEDQAYAYLLIPQQTSLTQDAQKRLKVLMEHSDLGSGFQIAMNDLKIRGGGTILGASQSGHIAAVGYDMFLKLMETAVAELRGEPLEETTESEVNVSISAYLSESYIPDIDQRMYAYRRLSRMTDLKEIADFKAELIDRYGALPSEAINLLMKISLKILSQRAGFARLDIKGGQMVAYFPETSRKSVSGLVDLIMAQPARFQMAADNVLSAKLTGRSPTAQIAETKNLLKDIVRHVNG